MQPETSSYPGVPRPHHGGVLSRGGVTTQRRGPPVTPAHSFAGTACSVHPRIPRHLSSAPSRETPAWQSQRAHLSLRLAMNSGMETVSISTKSALPNSRLSCSAMVLAQVGARPQVGALGPGLGRTARSGGVGLERGGGRSSVLGPARLWTGEAGGFRSSRGDCGVCGGRGGETETAAAGPASSLGPAGPRPALAAQAPPSRGGSRPSRGPAASSPGRRARAGRGRAPGQPWRLSLSAP